MNRVVITGRGAISALGHSVQEINSAMVSGVCGIAELEIKDKSRLKINVGAQIKNYNKSIFFSELELRFLDPFSQFALIAAKEALSESGLALTDELREFTGVIIGTGGGGVTTQEENFRLVFQENVNKVHPFAIPKMMLNAAASNIANKYELKGPTYSLSSACSSSNHAISNAYSLIRSGETKVMIAGGSEAMLTFGSLKAWEGLRVMSKTGCRPFCSTRNGLVQGEGSAIFVLEDYDYAKQRGAHIFAEILGCSMTSDGTDLVSPSLNGVKKAMLKSLNSAKINPDSIDYINAHGTGTKINDKVESNAISEIFSQTSNQPLVSSTKSMHGHVMGASGAIELLSCIYSLNHNVIMPTVGCIDKDPEIDINVVFNESRDFVVDTALSNSFAFGGLNSVIVLRTV